jgi:ferric-dicitrate binding protein FerR (iron transport regulator)
MNQEQAYQIVEQALNAATTKGVYNLQDAANILAALNVVRPLCVTEKTNEDGI